MESNRIHAYQIMVIIIIINIHDLIWILSTCKYMLRRAYKSYTNLLGGSVSIIWFRIYPTSYWLVITNLQYILVCVLTKSIYICYDDRMLSSSNSYWFKWSLFFDVVTSDSELPVAVVDVIILTV